MRRPRKTINQMNVVPYIDVMLGCVDRERLKPARIPAMLFPRPESAP